MRVTLFVDGSNFFYMQRNALRWQVDVAKLLEFARSQGELQDAFYYVGIDKSDAGQERFQDTLSYIGYSLITKPLKPILQEDGSKKNKANLDIEIVLDMFNTIEHYDLAILVSGDGDFERPLQLLRARGKRFLILSTEGFIAREIRHLAGMHYIDMQTLRDRLER